MANTADFNAYEFNVSRFNSDLLSVLLVETVTGADERLMSASISLQESQFLQDNNVFKQISKGFSEEVRIAAWLSIDRKNTDNWSDQ